MSTGSERFSLLICLDVTKLVLLSVFTLIKTICPKICSKSWLKGAKKQQLPVDVRRSKKLLLKLPIGDGTKRGKQETQRGVALHILKTNFNKSRLPGSSLIPYIPLTFPESRTVFWWNPGNLVPRALPLKKWVGRRPFFKGKAVGTRLKSRILGIPFPNRYENYPLKQALSNFEKGNLPAWPWGLLILISFVMVHIFWELLSALWFTVTEYIP